jgi:hypothetical protein
VQRIGKCNGRNKCNGKGEVQRAAATKISSAVSGGTVRNRRRRRC